LVHCAGRAGRRGNRRSALLARPIRRARDLVNLGPIINTPFNEGSQAFDRRGKTLYFYSDRPGGFGVRDLYAATRRRFCTQ